MAAAEPFVRVMVDYSRQGNPVGERMAQQYGISGIPAMVFLGADGREVDRVVGGESASALRARLQRLSGN